MSIPAGALSSSVIISAEPIDNAPSGHVGPAYEIGPTGTTFAHPITITFAYDASYGAAKNLRVATASAGGQWTALPTTSDATHIEGTTTHFSTYGMIVVQTGNQNCSSSQDCPPGRSCVNGSCG